VTGLTVSRPLFAAGDTLIVMAKTALPLARARVRVLAFVVPAVLVGLALAAGCAETRRELGSACLKSEDCLSGICSQLVCTAAPPLIDDEPDAEAGAVQPVSDANAPQEAAPAPEASTVPDASSDAGAAAAGD
jgi:hypothetical protein